MTEGNAVERLLSGLEALAEEIGPEVEPEPITDSQGRVWRWWKGDLWRHDHSAIPLSMLRKL